MENRYREIASSNNPVPILGQFLDETGVKDNAVNFAKNFVKDKFSRGESNEDKTMENKDNKNTNVVKKTQNFVNRINQAGVKADLSGIGVEKTFGDKDQGINTTVYGRQNFGGPAEYGARVGFNYKF
tara:strand:+ start:203 stop:583 length:381 start_codon:yes stop_codon:yes gene_type:complete